MKFSKLKIKTGSKASFLKGGIKVAQNVLQCAGHAVAFSCYSIYAAVYMQYILQYML